ncbi:MAG TPA: phage integrase N-terminal SAM-like domain-containing protein, partial [Bradyrhizobium sp.]
DMTVRNFVEKTRNDYIRQVKTFTSFLGRSPDTATAEDLRRFQLHQTRWSVEPAEPSCCRVQKPAQNRAQRRQQKRHAVLDCKRPADL